MNLVHVVRRLIALITWDGVNCSWIIHQQVQKNSKNIIIENFQGERSPRRTVIVGNTKVVPGGEDIILTGEVWTDITQTAANIELKTKVKNKDHRVFLDGIYAFEKKKGLDK